MAPETIKFVDNSTLQLYLTKNNSGQDEMHVAGTAKVLQKGFANSGWAEYQIGVALDILRWPTFDVVISSVSLSGISNKNESVHAGWIVDHCEELRHDGTPHLQFRLRIRDVDGYVNSVSFTALVVGVRGVERTGIKNDKSLTGDKPIDDEKPMFAIHIDKDKKDC